MWNKLVNAEKLVRRGVKEAQKCVRKNIPGFSLFRICILAGDVTPIDLISHFPVFCEEKSIPYIFIPSKDLLGVSCQTTNATAAAYILEPPSEHKYYSKYAKLVTKIKKANPNCI